MKINWFYFLGAAWLSLARPYCPPTGPVLPPPDISSNSNLTRILNDALEKLVKSGTWNATTTSFSVQLTSSKETFFNFHHTAPKINSTGVKKVDGKTIYRVASVTKVFTTLALLLQGNINLDDSITKYVPELSEVDQYKVITLRMLASQISGVHRDGYTFDLAATYPPKLLNNMGFPDAQLPHNVPVCDTVDGPRCTRSHLKNNNLVWQPGQRAAYSNPAFILLGFALENMTGIGYNEIIAEQISKPLGLSTAVDFTLQDVSRAIVPIDGGSKWVEMPLGNNNATAGLYATPDDLARFVRGILNHKLLSHPKTNSWLQPTEFTSSLNSAVGMPWEVFRTVSLTPLPRPVDVFTKSGNFGTYAAYIALIPEYDVGFTINAAGVDSYIASLALLHQVTAKTIPIMEQLARSQARSRYAGRYLGNSSSLVLSVDEGPGLSIKEWTSNGKSILKAWDQLQGDGTGRNDARIYPIGNDERWRVTFETNSDEESTSPFDNSCHTWFQVDQFRYQRLPVDEVDFIVAGGKVKGLVVPGLKQDLTKV
ncbi:beta-lactamase/transpeptidase-like protein [Fusarium austroafricanum]|uniref:Beta-lactamase/transpeptidase-like protein n=1 Tax=Fusarium austroafricanum TaxID=2364996 RepID=A0A8H4KPX6_9HYPO|nr:beta-lactamase/transpeptidase-like protein [Fusarium austroafricanum]